MSPVCCTLDLYNAGLTELKCLCPSCDSSYGPAEPMFCSVMHPCYEADCRDCNPVGSVPSYMRWARYVTAQIFAAKRLEYMGLRPEQTFLRDRRLIR